MSRQTDIDPLLHRQQQRPATPDSGRGVPVGRARLLVATVAVTLMLAGGAPAHAGTYPMYQCTAGEPSVSTGWSVYSYDSLASTVLSNTCSGGGSLGDYVFSNGQAGAVTENGDEGSQVGLALEAPASAPQVTIRSISATVSASGVSGDDAFLGFSSSGENLPGAVELPYGSDSNYVNDDSWTLPEGARNFTAYVNCSTDHSSTSCYFANASDVPALSDITLTLADETPPTISSVSGALANAAASDGTVSGAQTISFSAHDAGSGVRSATLTLTAVDAGSGYSHTFDFSGECTYASWNACPLTQTVGGYPLDTAELQDGEYTLSLSVTDAAGNTITQTLGTLRSANAPEITGVPSILTPGQILPGSALDATPGEWSAPSEAGTVSYSYQWQQCDSQGENCQDIAGAQNSSYTPTSAEVADTLRVAVAASDRDGHNTATSQATSPVGTDEPAPVTSLPGPDSPSTPTAPSTPVGSTGTTTNTSSGPASTAAASSNTPATSSDTSSSSSSSSSGVSVGGAANGAGASETAQLALIDPASSPRSYARSALAISGTLTGAGQQPIAGATLEVLTQNAGSTQTVLIAHAQTRADGSFTAHLRAGPSRRITIAYRAFSNERAYSTQASIGETVDAGIGLHIAPRHTGATGTISLRGEVDGPISAGGVLVELLVHYLGVWEPFRTPRTNSHGIFHIDYKFQGAIGAFPFRAEVPGGQAGFPYSQGVSNTLDVQTR